MIEEVKFGLLGKNISYSFSKNYFTEKFIKLNLRNHSYLNFDIPTIDDFPVILNDHIQNLKGINVTIPYKQEIFRYLDEVDVDAKKIGAVNTIKILDDFKLKGFNTDVYGFENSLKPLLKNDMQNALILGTGGASKAVAFVLNKLQISYNFVSRDPQNQQTIAYKDIDNNLINTCKLIINCTPLGTFPKVENLPDLPYHLLSQEHLLYDLIYNPAITSFLQKGKNFGAMIKNGEDMLKLQAERSWEIWNT
ncbi:MAG: shikimate dehydrogenase [Flavobacteriaceae bacterium]|nr:shikimate dehydrogenase [Flavobacteriaceae bacterium]